MQIITPDYHHYYYYLNLYEEYDTVLKNTIAQFSITC